MNAKQWEERCKKLEKQNQLNSIEMSLCKLLLAKYEKRIEDLCFKYGYKESRLERIKNSIIEERMSHAVATENYEEAALLRDFASK